MTGLGANAAAGALAAMIAILTVIGPGICSRS